MPLDGTAATSCIMEFVQRLQGRLFTDPPLGGLDELEDPDRPALVPPECSPVRPLASGSPIPAYGLHQLISSDLVDADVLRAEVDTQRPGQAERHSARLAIDYEGRHPGSA